ncbi:hypothetical protein [Micrococcus sp.]|uniref:hypothetical protein n=1 Tax=Micrococcus sp. TaxID=1271 RepID=UPI0026DB4FA5|nr:hypothetical protein [Micrococcus sp.]MDO4240194.1 hypothetical protein [Micrococcus sp.]
MPSPLAGLLVLVLLAAIIGGGLVWHEEQFYGRLRFQEKPPLELQNHMGVEGQDFFRLALRELRMALEDDRPVDAQGWVRTARRRGWWLAETAAASEMSADVGKAARRLAARRAAVEKRIINIEDTRSVGTLDSAATDAGKLEAARAAVAKAWEGLTPEQRERVRDGAEHHHRWATAELAAVIAVHCPDPRRAERLMAAAEAPVTDEDLASWADWEFRSLHWAGDKVPHQHRIHPERPPLPAYASRTARQRHAEAAHLREHQLGTPATPAAPHPISPRAAAPRLETAERRPYAGSAARRRAQARALHEEMTMKVASYDLDFDLQLAYPQFHNRDIPEVRALDGAARRAADEWDLVRDVPERRLAPEDVAAYREAVDAFKQAVLAADARVRLIGDAGITDEELRDLETARGLFRQISDPGNPPSLRDTYRARLVQVLRRIDGRPGSRVTFSPQALLELEAGEG